MSFDLDPGEQAQISGSDFAQICDEMKKIKQFNTELLEALELYALSYSDEELVQLAECTSGMGEIRPVTAKREVIRRAAIAKAKGEAK